MTSKTAKFKKAAKQVRAMDLLATPASHILLFGGSRSGKSFILIYAMIHRAIRVPGSRHLIVRFAFNHCKQSIWHDTFKRVRELCFPDIPMKENKSDWFIELWNGSQIWFGGLDDKERTDKILGNEYSTIYFNEVSQISYDSVITATTRLAQKNDLVKKAYYDCNPPTQSHWTYKLFIKKENPVSKGDRLPNPDQYTSMQMNPYDNKDNLDDQYIKNILETLTGRQRKRFLDGEFLLDVEGALWTNDMIDRNRVTELPEMIRVGIGVDPAVSTNPDSDETGIVVAGVGVDGMAYVLADYSGVYTPLQWAHRVLSAYVNHEANIVIAEVNQGGDLVESNIHSLDRTIKVIKVHASRGKMTRAEPIQSLYEQDRVKHYRILESLETQMTTWKANEGERSPDRVDALVWILTYMMDADLKEKKEFFVMSA